MRQAERERRHKEVEHSYNDKWRKHPGNEYCGRQNYQKHYERKKPRKALPQMMSKLWW